MSKCVVAPKLERCKEVLCYSETRARKWRCFIFVSNLNTSRYFNGFWKIFSSRLVLFLCQTVCVVCSGLARSSHSTEILSCYKYFTPNINISLLNLACLEVKIMNLECDCLTLEALCASEREIEFSKAKNGSFFVHFPVQKQVSARSLTVG